MPERDITPVRAWDQVSGESPKAYAAFGVYRDLGPTRSLTAAAGQIGRHLSLLKRWSQRHDWVERVHLWEAHARAEQEEASRRSRAGAYARRVENAEQLERVAMAGLRSLITRDPESGETRFVQGLRPTDIASLIRVACHLLPTEVTPSPAESEAEEASLAYLNRSEIQALEQMLLRERHEDRAEGEPDDLER